MAELRQRKGGGGAPKPKKQPLIESDDAKASITGAGLMVPLTAILVVRCVAAASTAIADCDETFNYWEPTHFITFGRGFQTWEYSPVYALRSYLFLLPYSFAAKVLASWQGRVPAFFLVRGLQGLVSFFVERQFVLAATRRFGGDVGYTTAWLLAVLPGMFVQAVAFLPSSVSMLLVCVVWAQWLSDRHYTAIFFGAAASIAVWPFTAILFVPLALHTLWVRGFFTSVAAAICCFAFWIVLSVAVDSSFYGRLVLPALEIVKYNVFGGSEKGTELYGVEPWHFYLQNGVLNLALVLPAGLMLPAVAVICGTISVKGALGSAGWSQALGFCTSAFLWFMLFSKIPHKEERFLVPIYPLLVLAAAISVQGIVGCIKRVGLPGTPLWNRLSTLFILATALISASRIAALHTGYAAPVKIYMDMNKELVSHRAANPSIGDVNVCIGVEWYRFGSSFFLPDAHDHLAYVRFGPTGLLPAEFDPSLGTSGIPPNMNDLNKEEESRYVDPKTCQYFIDLHIGEGKGDIPALRKQQWDVVSQVPFLDAANSKQPWRTFYVPTLSNKKNTYANYRLLKLVN